MVICDRCGTGKQYEFVRKLTITINRADRFDEADSPVQNITQDICNSCTEIIKRAVNDAFKSPPQPEPPVKYTKDQILNFIEQENFFDEETKTRMKEKFDEVMF